VVKNQRFNCTLTIQPVSASGHFRGLSENSH